MAAMLWHMAMPMMMDQAAFYAGGTLMHANLHSSWHCKQPMLQTLAMTQHCANPHPLARRSTLRTLPSEHPRMTQDDDAALAAALAASMEDAAASPAAPVAPSRASPQRQHPPHQASSAGKGAPAPAPTAVVLPDGCAVTRRIIASDNSCLFNAVGYVMEATRAKAAELRRVIAQAVAADPGRLGVQVGGWWLGWLVD